MTTLTRRRSRRRPLLPAVALMLLWTAGCSRSIAAPADAAFGIAECDSYFQRAFACVDRRPEAVRSRVTTELEQTRASWRGAAIEDGGNRDDLRTACRSALEVLERSPECR